MVVRDDAGADVAAEHVVAPEAEHGLGGRIEFEDAARLVDDDDAVRRRAQHGEPARLADRQSGAGQVRSHCRSDRRPDSSDRALAVAPGALQFAIVEPDMPPPLAVDHDRHGDEGEDALELEILAEIAGEIAGQPGDRLAAPPAPGPVRRTADRRRPPRRRCADRRTGRSGPDAAQSARQVWPRPRPEISCT